MIFQGRGPCLAGECCINSAIIGWKLSKVTLMLFNANCFWTNLFKSVSEPLKKQLRKNSIGIQWVIQHRNSIGNQLKCKVYRNQQCLVPYQLYSLRSTPFPRVNSVYCYFKIAGKQHYRRKTTCIRYFYAKILTPDATLILTCILPGTIYL